jgi:HK97 family phage portal protein
MKGLFGRMLARATDAVDNGNFGLGEGWGMASAAGISVSAASALQYTAVMTCVMILAEDLAKLPPAVFQDLGNGGRRELDSHYLTRLFEKPNDWQSRFEFMEMMQASLVLRSIAHAVIIRNGRGVPEQLIPIHPDRVSLYEAPNGDYFWFVTRSGLHQIATLRGMPAMIASDDMLTIRWLSTWHSLLGSSRVGLMKDAIGLGIVQEQQAARLAGSGARPGGVLQTDRRLSKEVADRVATSWDQSHGGWRNAGKTAILEEGLKWQQLGMTMVDAEFMESRSFQLEDIARGFRIPRFKLGLTDEKVDVTQMQQMYLNDVLSTWCQRWVPKLEELGRLDGRKQFVRFDYSKFLEADIQTRLTAMRTGVVGMIYTPNEARRGEGLPDVEGGDTLYQPVNVAPIGFTPQSAGGAGPGSDMTGEPAKGGKGDPAAVPDETPPGDESAPIRLVKFQGGKA